MFPRPGIRILVALAICGLLGGCGACEDPLVIDDDVGGIDAGADSALDTADDDVERDGGDQDTQGDSGDIGDTLDTAEGDTEDIGGGDDGGDTFADDAGDVQADDAGDVDATADADDIDDGGDSGEDDPPVGLSEPCQNGSGWTLFRFYYDQYSTSARIEVWDASCEYSLASGSACNVRTVTQGFGDVETTANGYPILTTSDYMRVRFSVEGLEFTEAEVHVEGHGFFSVNYTEYRVWSPLYGDRVGGPIDNTLQWSSLDWTGMLFPDDDPGLTAIQIYANLSTHDIAVRSVELCVE